MSKKVFVMKQDFRQVGDGIYPMVACFLDLGVHVPYWFEAHSENEYIHEVGEPIKCDGSCIGPLGRIKDWSKEGHDSSHARKPIVDKAETLVA